MATKGVDHSISGIAKPPLLKQGSGQNDHNTSVDKSLSHNQEPTADGSLSITSNIRNLIKGLDDENDANASSAMEVDPDSQRIKKAWAS